ncbi:MAG: CDP-glycerol glycerophosphotransferase family protein [Bacteroidetes bacterium]|nr:CDP-glycerol glycerophosphotransferase family protein [Bacteroidota bacterium]
MVFSYYLYKYPYKLLWYINYFIGKTPDLAFYCADPLDYEMFQPIQKFLPEMIIIAKNNKVKDYLVQKGIKYISMPSFPKAVIMARQMPYKFPVDRIIKFGFDHGLYQFKRWTSPENYNRFNIYFVSSSDQVSTARRLGIKTVKAIGYPKLDNAFNGEYDEKFLNIIKSSINIDPDKRTIIFTSTWDVAGLSALTKWIDNLDLLTDKYNILVTVHTWTSPKYIAKLKSMENILFIDEYDVTPYLMIADVLVGDYNSIMGEFCAFNKPIITFKVPESDRTIPEIITMIANISLQINDFNELPDALEKCICNPDEKSVERQKANNIFFYALDGKAGERAAKIITDLIEENY